MQQIIVVNYWQHDKNQGLDTSLLQNAKVGNQNDKNQILHNNLLQNAKTGNQNDKNQKVEYQFVTKPKGKWLKV